MPTGKIHSVARYLFIILLAGLVVCGGILAGQYLRPIVAQDGPRSNLGVVVTDGTRLNVRGGPNVDSEIVGKLAPGTEVEIIDHSDDGEWYRIAIDVVDEAWVAAEFVERALATEGIQPSESTANTIADDAVGSAETGDAESGAETTASNEVALPVVGSPDPADASEFLLLPTLTPTPTRLAAASIGDSEGALQASVVDQETDEEVGTTVASTVVTSTVTQGESLLVPTATPATKDDVSAAGNEERSVVSPITATLDVTQSLVADAIAPTAAAIESTDVAREEVTPTQRSSVTSTPRPTDIAPVTATAANVLPSAQTNAEEDAGSAVAEARVTATGARASVPTATASIETGIAETEIAEAEEDRATPKPTASATAAATPPPLPTPVATPSVPTAITQPQQMNVRSGPSTNYSIVTSVAAGTALEILALSPDGTWFQVAVPEQAEPAWVYAPLTEALGAMDSLPRLSQDEIPPEPTPEPAPVAAAQAASVAPPIVSAPPPAGSGFFGYGVQAHMLGGGIGQAMNSTSEMGFNWIKQQVEWKLFQPQPGGIGMGALGGIVSEAGNRGISVLFSVVNAPDWAREAGFDASVGGPPGDPQSYANFVGAMAGEFCGTALKAIEIWNEQNLHYEWGNKALDPAAYMALLRPSYASIKAACPSMLVISGALTPAGSNPPFALDDFAYLEGMYQNGLANYADGIGAHPSGYNVPANVRFEEACGVIQQTGNSFNGACDTPHHSWAFRSTMEGYRNIMVVYGDANKRIWPTEFGWAAGGAFDPRYAYANDNSFDEQAVWTVEAYQMMKAWGWVGPAFLWNLNFRVVADGTEKAQWGIVRNDYSPLPVYDALRAMPK